MPSDGVRAQSVGRERGVNDPGVAWSVRPRAIVCGGRSRPAVSMSDEARMQSSASGEFTGETGIVRARFDVVAWVHADGRHVREFARSARRRARFSATLRPRAARAARACRCPSWRAVAGSERETLTAPLSERVTLAIT
jgi:hypothetical protein